MNSESKGGSAASHLSAANKFMRSGQYDKGILEYTEAIKIDPNDLRFFLFRGVAHSFNENYPQALQDTEEALRISPMDIKANLRKVIVLDEMGKTKEADEALACVTGLYPVFKEEITNLREREKRVWSQWLALPATSRIVNLNRNQERCLPVADSLSSSHDGVIHRRTTQKK